MLRKLKFTTVIAGSALVYYQLKDSRSYFYNLTMPIIHTLMSPEESHKLAISMIKYGLAPSNVSEFPVLKTKIWDFVLDNPIGLAAGFDKDAQVIDGALDFGFGIIEVGSITPLEQSGNPLPRFFRLPE
jgi:dihydroorotate dehydrogenase